MSAKRIQELLTLMAANDLVELELQEGDFKVRLCKQQAPALSFAAAAPLSAPAPAAPAAAEKGGIPAGMEPIPSPIVGTFYKAPAPDAEPFVRSGTAVQEDTVVCIVEAMKVMNEVRAGVRGVIAEVLVQNGEAVEYGQPLFLVKP